MKYLALALVGLVSMSFTTWTPTIEKAKEEAATQHKYILLNFSGSDWCGPCIRMEKEFFGNEAFSKFATTKLVMVNADFPRQKKHELPMDIKKQNEQLAEKYNMNGAFPYTVLIDEEGKVLHSWNGLPKETPEAFTNEISAIVNATH
jgi:thioredoxin-related protein